MIANYIDLYCERLAPGFWGEPLNLISNLAFVISFMFLIKLRIKHKINFIFYFFAFMVLIIGFGSFVFHSLANQVGFWLDVIPIFSFITIYFWWANRFILHVKYFTNVFLVSVFLVATYALDASPLKHFASGSISYVPAAVILIFYAFYPKVSQQHRQYFLTVLILFILALIFRSSDQYLCDYIKFGSHFLWHILNAILLYKLCTIVALKTPVKE